MAELTGTLYLVATPLGNLEDITFRALRILAEVDLIAAEDTRHTIKLLNYYQIKNRLVSYYQHNEIQRSAEIITKLKSGQNIAVVTDAGMPGISDPGSLLVTNAIASGVRVVPIPGAAAVVTALAAAGLDTSSFWFEGFLPRKASEQLAKLTEMQGFSGTIVFYEAPHRLLKTLKNVLQVLGDRPAVIARELTKLHEEFRRGNLTQLIKDIEITALKGEVTLLVSGAPKTVKNRQNSTPEDWARLFSEVETGKSSLRTKIKQVATASGSNTKEVYQWYLDQQGKKK